MTFDVVRDFSNYRAQSEFQSLSITTEHGIRAGSLPGPLKDPFDRMLIAQAQAESLSIVSNEEIFDHYGIRRMGSPIRDRFSPFDSNSCPFRGLL